MIEKMIPMEVGMWCKILRINDLMRGFGIPMKCPSVPVHPHGFMGAGALAQHHEVISGLPQKSARAGCGTCEILGLEGLNLWEAAFE